MKTGLGSFALLVAGFVAMVLLLMVSAVATVWVVSVALTFISRMI